MRKIFVKRSQICMKTQKAENHKSIKKGINAKYCRSRILFPIIESFQVTYFANP